MKTRTLKVSMVPALLALVFSLAACTPQQQQALNQALDDTNTNIGAQGDSMMDENVNSDDSMMEDDKNKSDDNVMEDDKRGETTDNKDDGLMMEDKNDDNAMKDGDGEIFASLTAQNNSGQSGKATIKNEDGKAKVEVEIKSANNGVAQPAHIHTGACPTPGGVVYPLNNVVNGKSETVLSVSVDQLLSQLPLAINVHKSASEISTYVSCGNITK